MDAAFFIFIPPNAAIITPIAIKTPPSPAILAMFSDSMEDVKDIAPPIIMRMPVIMSIIPKPLKGGFFAMKNAINERIIGGNPNPIPLVMASKGKNPSPAPPPPTRTSIP